MEVQTPELREAIIFLVAAGIVVPLVHRLKVSPALAFLIVGIAIGPYGFAHFVDTLPWLGYAVITDLEGVRALAELGVVFLLFMIGLELSFDRLWGMRRLIFGLGGAQVVLTAALIAVIASLFNNEVSAAVVLGAGFALSSTAIVMQLLAENRRLGTMAGRASFSILLFQDLAVLPILFLVAAFAGQNNGSMVLAFATAIGKALIAVAAILATGRLMIRPVLRFFGRSENREMFLALVLLVIVVTALATREFGLSMPLGAFLAGLLLAETEYRHEVEVDIEPFKGLLLGLFFISVGMSIDVSRIAVSPLWLIASVFGLFLIKGPIIYILARLFGELRSVALETALLLGQGGEFAFVIVGTAASLGLIPNETAQFMLIVTSLTMIATPMVAYAARRLSLVVEAGEVKYERPDGDFLGRLSGHVIVIGYGRVGQMLGSLLEAQDLPHVALDIDAGLVASFHAKGCGVFHGDASRSEILRKLGVERAAALVVTMDNPHAAELAVASTRRHWPNLAIYARARDVEHAKRLIAQGAKPCRS